MIDFNINLIYDKNTKILKVEDKDDFVNFKNIENDVDVKSAVSLFLAQKDYLEIEDYEKKNE